MKHGNLAKTIGLIIGGLFLSQQTYANPQGAQVVKGTAVFSNPSADVLNINNSRNAIINWQKFNIGSGQTTNFIQPSSTSSVLNRVIGNNPSQILGNLNSNGRVFVINQQGILVGEGANINTAGFFGSTLNITDNDFLKGKLDFAGGGQGNFENQGYIHAGEDGSIVLIAPDIENGGVIEVENGNVILAAGQSISISSLQNASIQFEVTSPENTVTNLGKIIAHNGAASLFAGTLKHSGSIRASGLVQNADGSISLVATDKVEVSGSVDVSAEQGGYIEILGDQIEIQPDADINASGHSGAGEILIGGDQQGLNPAIKNATSTTIAQGAIVHADGIDNGDGGKIIVFAENDVHVHGEVTAKGGAIEGDGGFIETSGLKQLDITSVPDASAPAGANGEWLIDPNNIDIVASGGVNDPTDYYSPYTSSVDSTTLNVGLIVNALESSTNVSITTGAGGTELGDINLTAGADINLSSASTPGSLTLNAHNDININADITSSSGPINLTLNPDLDGMGGGQVNFANTTIGSDFSNVLIAGDSTVSGVLRLDSSDYWIINGIMTVPASGRIEFLNGSATNLGGSGELINNGVISSNSGCNYNDSCSAPSLNIPLTNNADFYIASGYVGVNTDFNNYGTINTQSSATLPFRTGLVVGNSGSAVLTLQAGSNIQGVPDASLTISYGGKLDLLTAVTIPSSMLLVLEQGIISNVQNLTLPDNFNTYGGTISGDGIMTIPSTATLVNSDGILNLKGAGAANTLTIRNDGVFKWENQVNSSDVFLSDAIFDNYGRMEINLIYYPATMNGDNSSFINYPLAEIITSSGSLPVTFDISSGLINDGWIELNAPLTLSSVNNSGPTTLTLANGAVLAGDSSFTGDVIVDSGGSISPGWQSIGSLNINGDLTVNPGGNLIFDLEVPGDSQDQLTVFGNMILNGGNHFVHWEGDVNTNIIGSPTVTFARCDSQAGTCLTESSPLQFFEPLATTGSSLAIVPGPGATGSFDNINFSIGSVAMITRWIGGNGTPSTPEDWNTAANWSTNSVPSSSDYVLIDYVSSGDYYIEITNQVTPAIAGLQSDAYLYLKGDGVLTLNGESSTTYNLDINGVNASIKGTGTLYSHTGVINYFQGNVIGIPNWVEYGYFSYEPVDGLSDLIFDGTTFNNNGFMRLLNTVVDADISTLSTGSIVNNGWILADSTVVAKMDLSTNLASGFVEVKQGTLLLNKDLDNYGIFDVASGSTLSTGNTILTMQNGSNLSGDGEILIPSGGKLIFNSGSLIDSLFTLTLNGGEIYTIDKLILPDLSNLNSGTLTGSGGYFLPASATMNIAGVTPLIFNDTNVSVDGTIDWSGSGIDSDIVLNNTLFFLEGGSELRISNTHAGAQIEGVNGQLFLLNSSTLSQSSTLQTNIAVPVTAFGNIELENIFSSLSFTNVKGLVLENGGGLYGLGSYNGDIQVKSGGIISPGLLNSGINSVGLLSINGDLTVESGAAFIFEMEADGSDFDQLSVSGNTDIQGGYFYALWNNYSTLNVSSGDTFDFVSSSTISGDFTGIFNAPGIATSTGAVVGNVYQYSPSSFAGSVVYWDAGGDALNWDDSSNWSSDVLPTDGDHVIIEASNYPSLQTVTAILGDIQLDNLIISSGNLQVTGNLYSQNLRQLANSTISGSGTFHNLFLTFDYSPFASFSIDTINNFGSFILEPFFETSATPYSLASNNFNNYGGTSILSTELSYISALNISGTNGFSNHGNFWKTSTGNMAITGTFTNELSGFIYAGGDSLLSLHSDNNNLGGVFVDTNSTFQIGDGETGVSLVLLGNSDFQGDGTVKVSMSSILDVQVPTAFQLPMTLELSNGMILKAHNLSIPDVFNINGGGTLTGAGTLKTDVISNGVININGGLSIINLDMDLGGTTLYWNSAYYLDEIVLSDSTLSILNRMEINNTDYAQITGSNGRLDLGADSFLTQLSSLHTAITVPVTTRGTIEINNPAGGLSFSGGAITLQDGAKLSGVGVFTNDFIVGSGGSIDPGSSSGTGVLTINGNVTFESDSVAIFEIHDYTSFDNLLVNGNVAINGGNLYVLWDGIASQLVSDFDTYLFITNTGLMTGAFSTVYNPLGITASSVITFTNAYQYQVNGIDTSAIVYWDGGADSTHWDDALNWSGDVLPGDSDLVIIEGFDSVDLNSITANLAGFQNDSTLTIGSAGNLIVSGNYFSHGDMLLSDNASVSGTGGTWHNLSYASVQADTANISISNINNYASLTWHNSTTAASNLNISSVFNNWGNHLIYLPESISNNLNYGGNLNNHGFTQSLGTAADLQIYGTVNNDINAEFQVDSGNVVFNGVTNLGGQVNADPGASFVFETAQHNFNNSLLINGDLFFNGGSYTGQLFLPAASVLDITAASNDVIFEALTLSSSGSVKITNATNLFQLSSNSDWSVQGDLNLIPGASIQVNSSSSLSLDSGVNLSGSTGGALSISGGTLNVLSTPIDFSAGAIAVEVINGGLALFDQNVIMASLVLDGTITNTANLSVINMIWEGGTLDGSGSTSVNDHTDLMALSAMLLDTQTLNLMNIANWSGSASNFSLSNATINNQALFTDSSTRSINGVGNFINTGNYVVNTGGTSSIAIVFDSTGSLDIQAGTLALSGGGSRTGSINVDGILQHNAGIHTLEDVLFSGTGQFIHQSGSTVFSSTGTAVYGVDTSIRGGNLSLSYNASMNNLKISGGSLSNTANLSTSNFLWSGGALTGAGNTTVSNQAELTAADSVMSLDTQTLRLQNTTNWSSSINGFNLSNGIINNEGVFTNTTTLSIAGTGTFNNYGSYILNSAGVSTMGISFNNNAGIIDIQSGSFDLAGITLALNGGLLSGNGTIIANVIADNGSTVSPGVSVGSLTIDGDLSFQSGSEYNLEMDFGTVDLINVTGVATINSGALLNIIGLNGYNGDLANSNNVLTAAGGITPGFTVIQPSNFTVLDQYINGTADSLNISITGLSNFWIAGTDGAWETATNWSRNAAPSSGEDVFIDDGSITITVNSLNIAANAINSLTVNSTSSFNLADSSALFVNGDAMIGILNLDAANLTVNGNLTADTVTVSNPGSILRGTGQLNLSNSLTLNSGSVSNWTSLNIPQLIVQGSSQLVNTAYAHTGNLDITNVTDKLSLVDTMMTTDSSGSMTGAGSLELKTGSDWIINATSFAMPVAMTLDLTGGKITNVEKLVFPGIVNAYQIDFVENGQIVIPNTTTFNYFAAEDIAPGVQLVNNGNFLIDSNTTINLNAQLDDVFVNNGVFNIASNSVVNLLSDLDSSNGEITLSSNSALLVDNGVTLTLGENSLTGNSLTGTGDLGIHGGLIDFTTSLVLADTIQFTLLEGSINNAQNLTIAGNFNWANGTINGTASGFTTEGLVTLLAGNLNTDWLITSTSVVDWTASNAGDLVITDATITNQGEFRMAGESALATKLTNLATKDFAASSNASFINQGLLLIDADTDTINFDLNFDNDGGKIGIISGVFSLNGNDLVLDQTGDVLEGFGTFSGNVINTAGLVTPGKVDPEGISSQIGTLSISGDYTQGPEGKLLIKLDSTQDGLKNDSLDVAGLFSAGGKIIFDVINGTSITQVAALINSSFKPLTFGSFAGKFSSATIPDELNFTLGEGGIITITTDNPLINEVANQLEVLLSSDDLDFDEMVKVMHFIDQKAKVAFQEEEDEDEEKRAPRLVCK